MVISESGMKLMSQTTILTKAFSCIETSSKEGTSGQSMIYFTIIDMTFASNMAGCCACATKPSTVWIIALRMWGGEGRVADVCDIGSVVDGHSPRVGAACRWRLAHLQSGCYPVVRYVNIARALNVSQITTLHLIIKMSISI